MSKTKITVEEFNVPVGVLPEIANLISENDLDHTILGGDVKEEEITLSIEYENDQRDVIHEIEDIISDYEDEEDDDEEEE